MGRLFVVIVMNIQIGLIDASAVWVGLIAANVAHFDEDAFAMQILSGHFSTTFQENFPNEFSRCKFSGRVSWRNPPWSNSPPESTLATSAPNIKALSRHISPSVITFWLNCKVVKYFNSRNVWCVWRVIALNASSHSAGQAKRIVTVEMKRWEKQHLVLWIHRNVAPHWYWNRSMNL